MSSAARHADRSEPGAASHPEEMKATVEPCLGGAVPVRATARATPTGLVAASVLVCVLLVPLAWPAEARKPDYLRAS